MRRRLREGVELTWSEGYHLAGSIENPIELKDSTAPLPDGEVDRLIEEVAEIKHLLFCRLLLSSASVLPHALRANSVEELLNDHEIGGTDLRDVCLRMENPGLQDVRDACADFGRTHEMDEQVEEDYESEGEEEALAKEKLDQQQRLYLGGTKNMPYRWTPKRETKMRKRNLRRKREIDESIGGTGAVIDFEDIDEEGVFRLRMRRIKVCGKLIYDYPSEKAVGRGGWLHFCIIAKNSDLHDAIHLCRHWDEFFELSTLALYHYFPGANWQEWQGDRHRQQWLQLVRITGRSIMIVGLGVVIMPQDRRSFRSPLRNNLTQSEANTPC